MSRSEASSKPTVVPGGPRSGPGRGPRRRRGFGSPSLASAPLRLAGEDSAHFRRGLRPGQRAAAGLAALPPVGPAASAEIPPGERRSGFDVMSRETQEMQRDDTANPGMLWVREGEA